MADMTHNDYIALARALNPKRNYALMEVDALEHAGGDFDAAAANQLRRDLGNALPRDVLEYYVERAEYMSTQHPGNGSSVIRRLPDGREVAVLNVAPNPSVGEFIELRTGYSPESARRLGITFTENDLRRQAEMMRVHELSHASDPRNSEDSSTRFPPGIDGLYARVRSETRADLVMALWSIQKTGSTHDAQRDADLRTVHTFNWGYMPDERGQPYPLLQHYTVEATQQVINDAAKNNYYRGWTLEQIAQRADELALSENKRMKDNHTLENLGDALRRQEAKIETYPGEQRLPQAAKQGVIPSIDGFSQRVLDAHRRLSGGATSLTLRAALDDRAAPIPSVAHRKHDVAQLRHAEPTKPEGAEIALSREPEISRDLIKGIVNKGAAAGHGLNL